MHNLYSLKIMVNILLVSVVASYTEKFKGSKKDDKIIFAFFLKNSSFPLTITNYDMTKNMRKSELGFSRLYRAFKYIFL